MTFSTSLLQALSQLPKPQHAGSQIVQAPPLQQQQPKPNQPGQQNILQQFGHYLDTPPMQGPIQPGADALPGGEQSMLTQVGNAINPQNMQQGLQSIIQQGLGSAASAGGGLLKTIMGFFL